MAIAALFLSLHPCLARAQPAARAEIPIREVILSDGERRYAVPISVGGVRIEASLDSGSTGLRVLPGVVPAASERLSGHRTTYSYDSGTQFGGEVAEADLIIGVMGRAKFQQIDKVGCRIGVVCPAAKVNPDQFGIQGSGLPNEGFKAILGVNMASDETPNPLIAMGVKRWIIELPRPGQNETGRLVLNPTDDEVAGYRIFPTDRQFRDQRGGLHDAIAGCLINQTTKRSICGPTDLDTGAPAIQVGMRDAPDAWKPQTPAMMVFLDKGQPAIGAQFTLGQGPGTHMTMRSQPNGPAEAHIFLGILPYFVFSALYNPGVETVGLKAR